MAKQIIQVRFTNLGFIPSITRKFIAGSNKNARNTIAIQSPRSSGNGRNMTPKTPNWENSPEAFLCRD